MEIILMLRSGSEIRKHIIEVQQLNIFEPALEQIWFSDFILLNTDIAKLIWTSNDNVYVYIF